MDKKKSILNITVSVGFKIITLIMSILVRRSLIQVCGNDVNGLNALYLSIIGFLAVAELGVGSAISFCMYRPIVEGDNKKVSALYQLFRKWYLAVGAVMLVCGLALTPFLHLFAKDYAMLDVNLYSTFLLMLVSVVITYLFGAKTALINAYKNNYITTAINSGGLLLQHVLQIVTLHATGSFSAYLLCRIAASAVQWVVTEYIARQKYHKIITVRALVDAATRKELSVKIRAMFMHKIGALLVNTVDNIIISAFIGVSVLGAYSNYISISGAMTSVIGLIFTSLISVVGHLYVQENKDVFRRYFEVFHLVNYVVGIVFFLGYYAVIDYLIVLLFGEGLNVSRSLSAVISINGFVRFMRDSALIFRDATGTFYNDRWKPLVEGISNFVLSLALVESFGVIGVIAATVFTNLLICHVIEPFVLYKNAFFSSPAKYYVRNYCMIGSFFVAIQLMDVFQQTGQSCFSAMVINGLISLGITAVMCMFALFLNKDICTDAVRFMRGK